MATIRSELLALQAAAEDGILHAEKVVEWARENPGSALHKSLQWNDAKAAHEYRVDQVRRLISVHVVDARGQPLLVSLSIDRNIGGGYRPIADVLKAPDLREVLVRDALEELERMQDKYARVEALAAVWAEADRVRAAKNIPRRRKKPQEVATATAA